MDEKKVHVLLHPLSRESDDKDEMLEERTVRVVKEKELGKQSSSWLIGRS